MNDQFHLRLTNHDSRCLREYSKSSSKTLTEIIDESLQPIPQGEYVPPAKMRLIEPFGFGRAILEKLTELEKARPDLGPENYLRHCLAKYLTEKAGHTLALDFGENLGWAIRIRGRDIIYGTEKLGPLWHKREGFNYASMQTFLTKIFLTYGRFKTIAYENVVAHKGVIAAHRWGGYEATLILSIDEYVTIKSYGVTAIKKSFTGSGKATKDEMIRIAEIRGFSPLDDNAADALAVLTHHEGMDRFAST